jgi:hypothetical protein
MGHPNADGIDKLRWFTTAQLQRGHFGKGGGNKSSSSSQQQPAVPVEGEGEEGGDDTHAEATDAAAIDGLEKLQLDDSTPTQQQQQQQQQEKEGRLALRMPVYRNRGKIANWLDILSRGQAPAVGLQVLHDQQQQQDTVQQQQEQGEQQEQEEEEEEQEDQQQQQQGLELPVLQELPLPAKWAAFAASTAAVEAAASHSAAAAGAAGGQAFLATHDAGAPAAGSIVAREGGGSRTSSNAPARWAIGVWSGQLARQQEQQLQERD